MSPRKGERLSDETRAKISAAMERPDMRRHLSAKLREVNERDKGPRYNVDDETGCWIWQRSTNGKGYPNRGHRRGIYQEVYGPYDGALRLHHHCGVRLCVSPLHASPLTQDEHVALHGELRNLDGVDWKDFEIGARIALSDMLLTSIREEARAATRR